MFVLPLLCSFSQFPHWILFCLCLLPILVLFSLRSFFQFLMAACVCESKTTGFDSRKGTHGGEIDSEGSMDEYEVFLSFRGSDTRQGFSDVLYHTMESAGVCVFRDDDEISIGEPIRKIFRAIESSQICVPVFSKTFASSSWCLDEVAKMMELHQDNVVPIFYDVKPDDVKLKTQTYRGDLKKHGKKYGNDQVKEWEDALKAATRIKGKEVLNTSHVEFCKQFVDEILNKLKPRKKYDIDHLVGIDNQFKSVMKLFDIESSDVRYIGIHGMGSIGKTTLAKAIFNEISAKFEHSCFLKDIRESSQGSNGLKDIQRRLQESLGPKFARGSNFSGDIKERFHKKKVLIVLDDVDNWEQIQKLAGRSNWFGSGSRVVVTTRDVNILNQYRELHEDEVRYFELSTLEDSHALELFNRYAFREDTPAALFKSLSREVVSTAGGLPLALKVIGSLLYNSKDEKVWREVISRSRKVPAKEVKERLKISFDALENDQKQIFLDIACLPIGTEKANALYMWEASGLYLHLGLARLHSMSLVRIVGDDSIWMHDQLRDLGKNIVCEGSVEDPGMCSRIWETEEALKVLTSKQGKYKVEALCAEKPCSITLSYEHFAPFQQLRFLKLAGVTIEGDFNNLLPKLAWFSWHLCPPSFNATNLDMKNLVTLDLSFSFITETWGGWSLIQKLNHLKVLDLSNCHNLTRTVEFSERNYLERLILRGCSKLHTIHDSIGKLERLKYLDLSNCSSLRGLPDEIGSLQNLEELMVSGTRRHSWTFNLPETICNLKSLLVLKLEELKIADIPHQIGGLVKLKNLSLRGCYGMKNLPESMGDLASLTELDLSETAITGLPDSLGGMLKLESLHLVNSYFIEELPDSIGCLENLKVLRLTSSKIRKLPTSIGMMKKLEEIDASVNYQLKEVPVELGMLSSLRKLNLSFSCITTLPSTITQLPLLEELYLNEIFQLQHLPELPLSLMRLRVSYIASHKMPDLSRLSNLMELRLFEVDDCIWPKPVKKSYLQGIEKLTNLTVLMLGLGNVTFLLFDLGSLTQLKELHLAFPSDMERLPLLANTSSGTEPCIMIPDLSKLKNLSRIGFSNCVIKEGLQELGVSKLEMVESVRLFDCAAELIEVCLLNKLKSLDICCCRLMEMLPDLSHLKNLHDLEVSKCLNLVEIPGLGKLESLSLLRIEECYSLERLEDLSMLEKLSVLKLKECPKLRSIEGTDRLSFSTILIKNCNSISNVDDLKKRSKEGSINGQRFENFSNERRKIFSSPDA